MCIRDRSTTCEAAHNTATAGTTGAHWLNMTAPAHTYNAGATGVNSTDVALNNVVREARALSNGTTSDYYGNIGLGPNMWPLIQMYDFTRYQTYDLVYERGGADETITLTFDRPAPKGLVFDKDQYGLKHEVGVTLNHPEGNLDPTDEDTWTFATLPTNASTYYNLYDENGNNDAANTAGAIRFTLAGMSSNFGVDSGVMKIDRNGPSLSSSDTQILMFQTNTDMNGVCSSGLCSATESKNSSPTSVQVVTFTETGANTGVFTNWDDALKTNMYINPEAPRGAQATFWWNDVEYSVLHNPFWGEIAYNTDYNGGIGAEWNSGELYKS